MGSSVEDVFQSWHKENGKRSFISKKKSKAILPNLTFTGKNVHSSYFQKHLGMVLDPKLNFDMHSKEIILLRMMV